MSRENLSPRSVCKLWIENPLINPRTNRSITKDGKVYKALEKECKEYQKPKSKSRTPSPPRDKKEKIGKKNSLRKSPCQEQPEKYKWIVGKGCHELIKRSPSPKPVHFHTIEKSLAKEFDDEVYRELGKKDKAWFLLFAYKLRYYFNVFFCLLKSSHPAKHFLTSSVLFLV